MTYLVILLIVALIVCLWFILKTPKADGEIVVTYSPSGKTLFTLELDRDPFTITQSKYIVFKVNEIPYEGVDSVEEGSAE